MNTMNHGGYTARIEFDERDNIFVGRILGLRSIISFHGRTVAELRREFVAAIKDDLQDRPPPASPHCAPASAPAPLHAQPGKRH